MRCPACGLVNTRSALRCDCGLDLKRQSPDAIDKINFEKQQVHRQRRIIGIAAMGLGLTLSLPALLFGKIGLFALFNLPFVFGLIWTIRGSIGLRELRGRTAEARPSLPKASVVRDE